MGAAMRRPLTGPPRWSAIGLVSHFIRVLAAALPACALAASSAAVAQPPGPAKPWIQVIDVRSLDAPAQAFAVSTALKQETDRPTDAGFMLGPLLRDLGCDSVPDSACLERMASRLDVRQFVWGYAHRQLPGQVQVELHLYSRGEPERYTDLVVGETQTNPADLALRSQVRAALTRLLTGGGPAIVHLRTTATDGQVLVDGRVATDLRNGEAAVSVRGGTHTIEVRAIGFSTVPTSVFVQPGTTLDVEIAAQLIRLVSTETEFHSSPTNWHKTVGWSALGLGAVFTVLGFWSTLSVKAVNDDAQFNDYKSHVRAGDVCDSAKNDPSAGNIVEMCDSAHLHEKLGWAFYGLGVTSIGAGILLLATDPGTPKSKTGLTVTPHVGRGGGGLQAGFVF